MTLRGLLGPHPPGRALDAEDLDALYDHPPGVLRVGMAVTLDGAVEVDGRSGGLAGADDRELLATLRSVADVVLVAAGTVRTEGYGPPWLAPERRDRRVRRGQPPLPALAVVTASAALDPAHRVFTERRDDQPEPRRPVVITTAAAASADLAEVADVVVSGRDTVDLVAALAALADRGLHRVLCEGGPTLVGSLLSAGLVGELCLTQAAILAGPGHVLLGGSGPPLERPAPFSVAHLLAGDDGIVAARYVARG